MYELCESHLGSQIHSAALVRQDIRNCRSEHVYRGCHCRCHCRCHYRYRYRYRYRWEEDAPFYLIMSIKI